MLTTRIQACRQCSDVTKKIIDSLADNQNKQQKQKETSKCKSEVFKSDKNNKFWCKYFIS